MLESRLDCPVLERALFIKFEDKAAEEEGREEKGSEPEKENLRLFNSRCRSRSRSASLRSSKIFCHTSFLNWMML